MGSSTRKMRLAMGRLEVFAAAAPSCPKCSKAMTPRTAQRAGSEQYRFWGCAGFPACLGTRPMK